MVGAAAAPAATCITDGRECQSSPASMASTGAYRCNGFVQPMILPPATHRLVDALSGVERRSLPRSTPSRLAYRSIHAPFANASARGSADAFGLTSEDACALSGAAADRSTAAIAKHGPIGFIRRIDCPGCEDVSADRNIAEGQ